MQRLPNGPVRFQFGVRGWAAIAVGLAILAAIGFLAIGVFLLILPVALLAPIVFRFLPKPKFYRAGTPSEKAPATAATVIEGNFKVIDSKTDRNSDAKGA